MHSAAHGRGPSPGLKSVLSLVHCPAGEARPSNRLPLPATAGPRVPTLGLGPLDLGASTAPGVTELVLVAMVALPAVMHLVFAMPLSVAPADS